MTDNPFLLSKTERLKQWRHFRKTNLQKEMSDIEHLQEVANWWTKCPLENRIIDPYTPSTWPSGWELVYNGKFCKSSIGLGMEQTLILREKSRWSCDRITLALIDDNSEDIYLAPIIDEKYILNYDYGYVANLDDINNVKILKKFLYKNNKHIELK